MARLSRFEEITRRRVCGSVARMRYGKILGIGLLLLGACTGGNSGVEVSADGNQGTDDGGGVAPLALHLLVDGDGEQCPSFVEASTAHALFSVALEERTADVVGIADAKVVEECSGAGGTHVFSSRTQEGKRFWLGQHACMLSVAQSALESGVVVGLGSQTAGLFQGQEGWCMNYPGENEVFTTDVSTSAMAWFASRAEAERFIASL